MVIQNVFLSVKNPRIEDIVKKTIKWCWDYGMINSNTKISAESCRELLLQLGTEALSTKYNTCEIFRTVLEKLNGEPIFTEDMVPDVHRIKTAYGTFLNTMISVNKAQALTKSMTYNDTKPNIFSRLKKLTAFGIISTLMTF